MTTEGPSWGHFRVVLGAIGSFLKAFCGHLLPKIDRVSEKLTLRYPHEGPCVEDLVILLAGAGVGSRFRV